MSDSPADVVKLVTGSLRAKTGSKRKKEASSASKKSSKTNPTVQRLVQSKDTHSHQGKNATLAHDSPHPQAHADTSPDKSIEVECTFTSDDGKKQDFQIAKSFVKCYPLTTDVNAITADLWGLLYVINKDFAQPEHRHYYNPIFYTMRIEVILDARDKGKQFLQVSEFWSIDRISELLSTDRLRCRVVLTPNQDSETERNSGIPRTASFYWALKGVDVTKKAALWIREETETLWIGDKKHWSF